MVIKNVLAFIAAISLMTSPALAQPINQETNGHHYQGGPKTEVPHHMGKKETTGSSRATTSNGHHYSGGPAASTPHHMGEKQ
jgi:hypothetical protein